MTHDEARKLLDIYGRAWITRDPDLILTIFTQDATYADPKEPVNYGHEGIRSYWLSKVVDGQRDIDFKVLNVWIDGETVIAEWEANFTDTKRNVRIRMFEVAICTVRDGKWSSLREYYRTIIKNPL